MNSNINTLQVKTIGELLGQLAEDELKEFHEMSKTVNPDQQTQLLCLQYFITFKRQMGYISPQKITIAIKCAYFMAEKSQFISTVGGEKVTGYSLSLNKLLQTHRLEDILITLKQFIKKVRISDQKAEQELTAVVEEISFLIKLYSKFDSIIKTLDLKERFKSQNVDYLKTFTSLVWLIYIYTKKQTLKRSLELVENTCLMAHAISSLLVMSWDYVRPMQLMTGERPLSDQSSAVQVRTGIRDKILQKFYIRNKEVYKHIAQAFEQSYSKLMASGIFKGQFVNKNNNVIIDFIAPQVITGNYQRIDNHYRRSLDQNQLDERIFFQQRTLNLTPNKITPFAKQGYVNRLGKDSQKGPNSNLTSHRILTYENIDHQDSGKYTGLSNLSNMKIPKSVQQTPSTVKVPLICTPMTSGMEMFNYLSEKIKKIKGKKVEPWAEVQLKRIFEKDSRNLEGNFQTIKMEMIFCLYWVALSEYLKSHSEDSQNQQFHRALLGLSTEIVFFISNINISLQTIEQSFHLQAIQEWKACDFFLNFDKSIPSILKLHLLDIQVNILSVKIWSDAKIVAEVQSCARDDSYSDCSIQRLFKRLIHQIAYQITQLSIPLNLDEDMSGLAFQSMKELLLNSLALFENQHLDQLILGCIFINCKIKARVSDKYKLTFNQIISVYEQANPNNKKLHSRIIHKIEIDDRIINIVDFYNEFIVPALKSYFKHKNQHYKENGLHKRRNSVLQSPLKNIIPMELMVRQAKRTAYSQNKQHITPQSSLLLAYNESPMLKCEYSSYRAPFNSKKIINFDQEQQKLLQGQQQVEEQPESQSSIQANDFISKRFNKQKSTTNSGPPQMIHQMPITSSSVLSTKYQNQQAPKSFRGLIKNC